jgi:Complex I intermediate-associated protein 30 (CIA30).
MKTPTVSFFWRRTKVTVVVAVVFYALLPFAKAGAPALVDDFSNPTRHGADRLLFNDKDLGSQSHATQTCADGVLKVEGELVPGRGVPAFISVPLILSGDMQPQDLSAYEGVRLRVKVNKGILSVQVASAEVTNFDYHTGGPVVVKRGEFQEVRLAFKDMKRAWSEQTPLNLKTITSVNLVAFGMAKDAFSYEVDEIGFY